MVEHVEENFSGFIRRNNIYSEWSCAKYKFRFCFFSSMVHVSMYYLLKLQPSVG